MGTVSLGLGPILMMLYRGEFSSTDMSLEERRLRCAQR